jgi:hypothetical protein
MYSSWWRLPGPVRFVGKIIEELREGKNVIIGLPETTPDSLYQAVRDTYDDGFESWQRLKVNQYPSAGQPLALLLDIFGSNIATNEMPTANTLFSLDDFTCRGIWVEGISETHWPAWREFLEEYQHAC